MSSPTNLGTQRESAPIQSWPGGYCASPCGVTGRECEGACVATAHAGEVCAAHCGNDNDCRVGEGYLCDLQWHACIVPGFAAIVPIPNCPATVTGARDLAFGPAEPWSTANAPGVFQVGPSAVLTEDGGVTAWFMARSANREGNALATARLEPNNALTIDLPFKSQRANHEDPWLARDRKGVLYAVWLGFDTHELGQEIGLARSVDRGATWSSPIAVHAPTDCSEGERDCLGKPMIAVGPRRGGAGAARSNSDAVYVMYGAGRTGLHVRASVDGGATFGPPVTALAGDYGTSIVGADGKLHVVTINGSSLGSFGSAMQQVEYAGSTDGGTTFTSPVVVSGGDEVLPYYFANPAIAVDPKRKQIYIVYVRGGRDARWDLVLASSKDGGATWTRTKVAGDGCAIHMVPTVALDDKTGELHVVYYDNEGGAGRFAHTACTPSPRGMKCAQRGAINSAPFALSTVRHGASWLGDYESLVVDTKRRALHAVWTQPVLDDGKLVSRIFHARAALAK